MLQTTGERGRRHSHGPIGQGSIGQGSIDQGSIGERQSHDEAERHRQAIVGLERRLERDESRGEDTSIARLVLMQHYAAYAAASVRQAGGSVHDMKMLTDRHNIMPLAWRDGVCCHVD